MGLGSRNIGLPGQGRGQKAHYYFMMGHAAAYTGKVHMGDAAFNALSKACQNAYEKGWEKGLMDRKQTEAKKDDSDIINYQKNQEESSLVKALVDAGISFTFAWRKVRTPSRLEIKCPVCGHRFETDTPDPGHMDEINCPNCNSLLRMESEYRYMTRYDYGMDKGIRVVIFDTGQE